MAPIAIVGMACRLPGGIRNPDEYWQFLCRAEDAITNIPSERWSAEAYFDADPAAAGRTYAAHGGFIDGIDRFDAGLFDISPREAEQLDPQQRMLLEESWTALEDSGDLSAKLAGSRTGVFVGAATHDYERRHLTSADPTRIDVHSLTGSAVCIASGRIAYALGLEGPAITVDTACSSSLVAVHLACQSLREEGCELAIAGGVNALLDPALSIYLSRARALSAAGRCRAFDESADGFVRSEGCAIIVLRRLSDALARGDRIRAVIRGSALNNDGRSNGLTAPNGAAQRRLLSDALRASGVEPHQVGYVEAHGTGTPLGDPIEFGAIASVFGQRPPDLPPLAIGSVKTNLGHLEAAAGVTGLMKVVLSLQHGQIPAHLHLKKRNPYLGFEDAHVVIPTQLTAWPTNFAKRVAGVSAFGFSGTNAHVILEEAPPSPSPVTRSGPSLLALAARSAPALRELAARYLAQLEQTDAPPLGNLCDSANAGRLPLPARASIVARDRAELSSELRRLADGEREISSVERKPGLVFLFSGQGSAEPGVLRGMVQASPTFRTSMEHFDQLLVGWGEPSILGGPALAGPTRDRARRLQPAFFAMQMSLVALWRALGVTPGGVLGHSLGEYAAACTAGLMDADEALRLVVARARLTDDLALPGSMWRVQLGEEQLNLALRAHPGLSIAAHNGPEDCVVSGADDALAPFITSQRGAGIRVTKLEVTHAFHSEQMDPMLQPFRRAAANVGFRIPHVTIYSTLLGRSATLTELASPQYWCDHLRCPVRFDSAVRAIDATQVHGFVEIGLVPQLIVLGQRIDADPERFWLPSGQRGHAGLDAVLASLGTWYERGGLFDPEALSRELGPTTRVAVPTYPFQRRRHWLDPVEPAQVRSVPSNPWYQLARVESPALECLVFSSAFTLEQMPLVADHRVQGAALVNLVVYLTLITKAFELAFGQRCAEVADLCLGQALILAPLEAVDVQVLIEPHAESAAFRIVSRARGESGPWLVHATGIALTEASREPSSFRLEPTGEKPRRLEVSTFYQILAQRKVELGPACRGLERLYIDDRVAWAELKSAAQPGIAEPNDVPLALIDSAFQSTMLPNLDDPTPRVIVGFRRLRLDGSWRRGRTARAEQRLEVDGGATARFELLDADGQQLVTCEGIRFQPLRAAAEAGVVARSVKAHPRSSTQSNAAVTRKALLASAPGAQTAVIADLLRDALVAVLRLQREEIADIPLARLGLDSFMAMELVERIWQSTGVRVSLLDVLEGASVPSLAAAVEASLAAFETIPGPAQPSAIMEEGSI